MPVPREKLYEELWSEPALTVATRYGVSSVFLAKVCRRLRVPTPPRGYWARIGAGKRVKPPKLPTPRPGDPVEWVRPGESPTVQRPELRQSIPVRYPRGRRREVHPLIAGVRRHFDIDRVAPTGHVRPLQKVLVDVYVSKEMVEQALRTANALFLELEDRGHRVVLAAHDREFHRPPVEPFDKRERFVRYDESWEPRRPTVAYVGGVAFGLTLFELTEVMPCRREGGRWVRASDTPADPEPASWIASLDQVTRRIANGLLCLRATCPYPVARWERRWAESEPGELLKKLGRIADQLVEDAPNLVAIVDAGGRDAERRAREAESERELRLREEEERRREEERNASRNELLAAIDAWGVARRVEDFFAEAEDRAVELPEELRTAVLDRVARGRALLADVDPLARLLEWQAPEEQ